MPSVLVTGASRGIGKVTTLWLAARGWDVIVGVRRPDDGEALTAADPERVTAVTLDVTDSDQIAALDASLPETLDAVVNNAGVIVAGPLEATPLDDLRRQLDVNVVGQAAVTQAVLPRLRTSRGRVLFVSSLSGRVATPMFGPYNASKFALEGMADALRLELAPWAIRVVLIEPVQTDTDLWRHAEVEFDQGIERLAPEQRRLYARHLEGFRKTIPRSQKAAGPPDRVAATIEKALTDRRPRARYVVGASARSQALVARLLPTPALDALLRTGGGVPRRL
jgi:NAD(P)-dependent dehydrogenase (short-subunit alcohol dehydrogenase family)